MIPVRKAFFAGLAGLALLSAPQALADGGPSTRPDSALASQALAAVLALPGAQAQTGTSQAPTSVADLVPDTAAVAATDTSGASSAPSAGPVAGEPIASPTLDVPVSPAQPVVVAAGDAAQTAISLPHDGSSATQVSDGLTAFGGTGSASSTVVQPTAGGVRIYSVSANADAPTRFDYGIDPAGIGVAAQAQADGGMIFFSGDGVLVGQVAAPWARDAAGREIPTHYEFDSGTLTQVIDETDNVIYPLVADPGFNYAIDLEPRSLVCVGYGQCFDLPVAHADGQAAIQLLRHCFNCYFPIPGAPHAFPVNGQVLPLKIKLFSDFLTLASAPVKAYTTLPGPYGTFEFIAQAGHFDGAGSTIYFQFYQGAHHGPLHLAVTAHIANSHGSIADYINRKTAQAKWQDFLQNVNQGLLG